MKIDFEDPRIMKAIEDLHAREDDETSVDVPDTDVTLFRLRCAVTAPATTLRIAHESGAFVAGFGVRGYNSPQQINVTSIISGTHGREQLSGGAGGVGVDVAYFDTPDDLCPFDLGCFSNLGPLFMTFEPIVENAKLEMILVGQRIPFGQACAGESPIDWPKAPEPEAPKPLGDPGWVGVQVTANGANVSVFEDVSPIRPAAIWEEGKSPSALHGVVGTVIRRGPFALQIWVGDGSPRHVIGLRVFNAPGMFEIRGIYNSLERRTILHGAEIDVADFGADEIYAEIDMGVVSKEKPLLLELDNVTPAEVMATLNMILVSVPVPVTADDP